jgi:hypothetical protein
LRARRLAALPPTITHGTDHAAGRHGSWTTVRRARWNRCAAFDSFARLAATRKLVVLGNIEEPPGKAATIASRRTPGAIADAVICVGDDNMTSLRAAT